MEDRYNRKWTEDELEKLKVEWKGVLTTEEEAIRLNKVFGRTMNPYSWNTRIRKAVGDGNYYETLGKKKRKIPVIEEALAEQEELPIFNFTKKGTEPKELPNIEKTVEKESSIKRKIQSQVEIDLGMIFEVKVLPESGTKDFLEYIAEEVRDFVENGPLFKESQDVKVKKITTATTRIATFKYEK